MKKYVIVTALVLTVFLFGCERISCSAPCREIGNSCCLDYDSDNVCDSAAELRRDLEIQPKIETVEKTVIKYICWDGREVAVKDDCPAQQAAQVDDVQPDIEIPELIKTNEQGTVIEEVSFEAACVKGVNGGQIYFEIGTVPKEIQFQVKEPGKEYETVYSPPPLYYRKSYFAICDRCWGADFRLDADKVYIFRIMFNQTPVYNRVEYSNEYLIDTRADSEYRLKLCSS